MKNEDIDIKEEDNSKEKRVVADMNIEGMPWYVKSKPLYDENKEPNIELDKKELRRLTLSATLGGLLIGAVFMIVFFLFILFCILIWF